MQTETENTKKTEAAIDNVINEKFNQLLNKIDNQQRKNEEGNKNKGENVIENEEEGFNKDRALKSLFDESVDFKNNLANLRT